MSQLKQKLTKFGIDPIVAEIYANKILSHELALYSVLIFESNVKTIHYLMKKEEVDFVIKDYSLNTVLILVIDIKNEKVIKYANIQ